MTQLSGHRPLIRLLGHPVRTAEREDTCLPLAGEDALFFPIAWLQLKKYHFTWH